MTAQDQTREIHMQVMWNRLISVVEEQAMTLLRTAFSTSVREAGDLSAGVFDLRLVTGYAKAPPAGTRMPYREATATLRCVDDASSSHYNQLADDAKTPKDWSSAEEMRRQDDLYRLVVWVGHNDAPVVPPDMLLLAWTAVNRTSRSGVVVGPGR